MKNYHFSTELIFTIYKWIAFDLTIKPNLSNLFSFSVQRKTNCSFAGIYINFSLLNLFNIWFSIFDERILNTKDKRLGSNKLEKSDNLQVSEDLLKKVDSLLGDLVQISPKIDQMFFKYDGLPENILSYKEQFNSISKKMENQLRKVITQNQ